MVPASDLKTGTILQLEQSLYKVLATEYHMGGEKMSSLQDEVYKPATLSHGIQDSGFSVYQSQRCGEGKCGHKKIY